MTKSNDHNNLLHCSKFTESAQNNFSQKFKVTKNTEFNNDKY